MEGYVCTDLGSHYILYYRNLKIVPQICTQKGQRYYVPVRGKLKKKTMIQPNVPETEILGECCGHDVDQFICLSYNAKGVVKYAVPKQSVRKGGFCLPAGNGKFCFHPCVGRFFKFIVPDIMVGIVLLYKPVRGLPAENEPSA